MNGTLGVERGSGGGNSKLRFFPAGMVSYDLWVNLNTILSGIRWANTSFTYKRVLWGGSCNALVTSRVKSM